MKFDYPRVAIIILNWNGWEDTLECLESVFLVDYPRYEVIVVDNASKDESTQKIRDYCSGKVSVRSPFFSFLEKDPIDLIEYSREAILDSHKPQHTASSTNRKLTLIKNEKNYGFAEGNNIGIRYALETDAEYVLILNNDTVVDSKFLRELVNTARSESKIGVVGPKICFYDAPQVIQTTGVHQDFWTGRSIPLNYQVTTEGLANSNQNDLLWVDYVYGACLLAKREVIEAVGVLDPIYFLYGEERDWCFRVTRSGYKVACNLKSTIWHKSMASSIKTLTFSTYCPARNTVLFMRRYANAVQFLSFVLFFPAFNLTVLARSGRWDRIRCFLRGFLAGLLMRK